ncbi:hypothetical protein [Paraliomyxa miuraensis]|uniref:hypothetical protein n=1 Tax=Paraliomyxa miuraensis TaxID=376150 RepID=UPI0022566BAF|nr:hypothetical protein [Paraliomyxa miuraensis]MCX4241534.1 hypothetical protein [Paraliomyxa miuraensis]
MSELLLGPFGELYELSTRFDPAKAGAASTVTLQEAESWSRTFDWIVDHPSNLEALRRALMRAVPQLGADLWSLPESRLLELFSREVASGEIMVMACIRERPSMELLDSEPSPLATLTQQDGSTSSSPPKESEPAPAPVIECILAVVTYECSHVGKRKAALRLEVGTAQSDRTLEVVAGDQDHADTITVKPEWTAAACGVHQPKVLSVTGPGVRQTLPDGELKVQVFYSRIDSSRLLDYFWAWNMGPAEFTLSPQACTGHGVHALVRVYPELQVEAKLVLALNTDDRVDGKMELAQQRGYHEKRGRPAHTEWKFELEGKVKYGGRSESLGLKYEDKIKKWAAFNRLIKRAIDKFVEYFFTFTGVTLRPLFPNLQLEYKGQYTEIEGKTTVGTEWSVMLKADPLIGLELRIEILDVLIKALGKTQFAIIAKGLAKVREWAKERDQVFEIFLAFQGLIAGEIGAKKKPELARASVNGMIQGALKVIFEARASFGSTGWFGFAFGAEVKGNTGFAVRLQLDHDSQGVFLVGKFVLLECKFECAVWASGKFIWELKEGYEGEFKWWEEQDLLKTGNKYVLTSGS